MKRLFQISIASLLLTACGGDGPSFGPPTTPTPTQQDAITSTEDGLVTLAAVDVNGPAAGAAALVLVETAQLLFEPAGASGLGGAGGIARVAPRLPGAEAMLQRALLAECPVMNANSIVWDACIQDGITFDGQISWGTGHVDVDLHIFGSLDGVSLDYTLNSSMTVSASAITGDMTVKVSASANGMQITETLHSEIDVTVADGCITSGTFTATASGSGTGSVSGAVQIVWTGCHMAQVRKG
ncbi:MAG TPA: hypothetical protein VFK02_13620 [Kofleriaceae bacterium]|nr:hypothetical protein [Kofleriaceae bacterium]